MAEPSDEIELDPVKPPPEPDAVSIELEAITVALARCETHTTASPSTPESLETNIETTSLLMKDAPGSLEVNSTDAISGLEKARLHEGHMETHLAGPVTPTHQRSSSTPVGRSLFQTVRAKAKAKISHPSSGQLGTEPSSSLVGSSGSIQRSGAGHLLNGHAEFDEVLRASKLSPRTPLQKRRLKLDLHFRGSSFSAFGTKSSSQSTTLTGGGGAIAIVDPPTKSTSLYTSSKETLHGKSHLRSTGILAASAGRSIDRESKQSAEPLPTISKDIAQATVSNPAISRDSANNDEHQLIAFCSALLEVSPSKPATMQPPTLEAPPRTSNYVETSDLPFPDPPASVSSEPPPVAPKPKLTFPPPSFPEPYVAVAGPIPEITEVTEDESSLSLDGSPPDSPLPNHESLPSTSYQSGPGPPPPKELPSCSSHEPDAYTSGPTQSTTTPALAAFQRLKRRLCTSFRLEIPTLKNPVDACLLPNDFVAVADYDNGFVILNPLGEIVHHRGSADDRNACGISCWGDSMESMRLYVLVFREGSWSVNIYANFSLIETIRCPSDAHIESWALRKIGISAETSLHLMASGEAKIMIWLYEFLTETWRVLATENSRRGGYNDISVRHEPALNEIHVLLCDWRKSQLCTVAFSADKLELRSEEHTSELQSRL